MKLAQEALPVSPFVFSLSMFIQLYATIEIEVFSISAIH